MTPGTLFFAASIGKGVTSSVVHVLAERGTLAYDQRVADVWPEFGAHGKDVVTLADVLVHAAGVPGHHGVHTHPVYPRPLLAER